MKRVITKAQFDSDEAYFLFEEKSELRHELINENLFEMNGVSAYHNDVVLTILLLLKNILKGLPYKIAFESFKVRTPNGNYFYPDVMLCEKDAKRYYAEKAVLIIEVLAESTRKFNLVDKFIQYQKIETLQYYLCIEPEQQVIFFYFKTADGEWMTETYTQDGDTINMQHLQLSFTLKDIYKPA